MVRSDYVIWRLYANKRRERRQNDMEMRVKRLYRMMQMESACRLRGVLSSMIYRVLCNIVGNYEP